MPYMYPGKDNLPDVEELNDQEIDCGGLHFEKDHRDNFCAHLATSDHAVFCRMYVMNFGSNWGYAFVHRQGGEITGKQSSNWNMYEAFQRGIVALKEFRQ